MTFITCALTQSQIIANFSRIALHYAEASVIPQETARRMLQRLSWIRKQPQFVADLGCGTGFATQLLQQHYPEAMIIGIDLTREMLLQAAPVEQAKVSYLCSDAYQLPLPAKSIDLVFANFLLPWCEDILALFAECQRILKPGGLFMFTALGPDTFKELRWCRHAAGVTASAQLFMDMHAVGDLLLQAKFAEPVMDVEFITLAYQDEWKLLRDLKNQGIRNLSADRIKSLCGKHYFERFFQLYKDEFSMADKILPLTYEIIYGQAWMPKDSVINIPLADIRRKRS